MLENREFVGIKKGVGYKLPKSSEACQAYGIEFSDSEAHSSYYDAFKTFELFNNTIR